MSPYIAFAITQSEKESNTEYKHTQEALPGVAWKVGRDEPEAGPASSLVEQINLHQSL